MPERDGKQTSHGNEWIVARSRVCQSLPLCLLVVASLALGACGGSSRPPTHSGSSTVVSTTSAPRRVPSPHRRPLQNWPTYHGDGSRTGARASGPPLGQVRRLWSAPVDEAVYAEPLVVGGTVVVATENNSVYAFDAATGRRVWRTHFGTPVSGGDLPCGDIDPSGITSTPVADSRAGVLYTVAFQSGFHHILYAVSLASGRVLWSRDADLPGSDPRTEQQRSALALANGRVYIAYGGLFGDCGNYHGLLVGAPQDGPGGALVSYQVPSQNEGAIWAPSGPAVGPGGEVYIATGNGSSASFDFGNAVIKLTPRLQMLSFFAPPDAGALSQSDLDLGSTGPVLLPGSRLFVIGKSGVGYLLDSSNLGGIGHPVAQRTICAAAFGGSAYSGGTLYVPCSDGLVAVGISGDSLSIDWRRSDATEAPIVAGGAVWSVGGDRLYQLDPGSGDIRFSTDIGTPAHFASPTAAGGRIYVAAGGRVQAFG